MLSNRADTLYKHNSRGICHHKETARRSPRGRSVYEIIQAQNKFQLVSLRGHSTFFSASARCIFLTLRVSSSAVSAYAPAPISPASISVSGDTLYSKYPG